VIIYVLKNNVTSFIQTLSVFIIYLYILPENYVAEQAISICDVKQNDKYGGSAIVELFSSRLLLSGRGYGLAGKQAGPLVLATV
jgi:hypothetical protein